MRAGAGLLARKARADYGISVGSRRSHADRRHRHHAGKLPFGLCADRLCNTCGCPLPLPTAWFHTTRDGTRSNATLTWRGAGQIIIYTAVFNTTEDETAVQIGLNIGVVLLFLADLTLRQVAWQLRFWKEKWNVFDAIVIWASVLIMVGRYSYRASAAHANQVGPRCMMLGVSAGF